MNYIFLDVDGVLNNHKYVLKQAIKYDTRYFCDDVPFNPRSLKNLRKIVEKTDAKIILTSSWRLSDRSMTILKARLAEYGLNIKGQTKMMDSKRGLEIRSWLQQNGEKKYLYADCKDISYPDYNYIILDDEMFDIFDYHFEDNVVKINSNKGLTYFKMKEAIKKIHKQEKY